MNRRHDALLYYDDAIDSEDEGFDDFFESDLAEYYDEDLEEDPGEVAEDYYDEISDPYDDDDMAYESEEVFYEQDSEVDQEFDDPEDLLGTGDAASLTEGLREALHESYLDVPEEEVQTAWAEMLEGMTPAEGFNFNKVLRQIGKTGRQIVRDPTVGQIARTALPVAGATIGTIYGGPMGGALGGQLGQAAGQVFTGGTKPAVKATAKPTAKTAPAPTAATKPSPAFPAAQTGPQAGSVAAIRLLQMTQDPNVLKSLLALALGARGRQSVEAGDGGPPVNLGSYMNLLGTLANQAAADADALAPETGVSSGYLLDADGEFITDPANPEARAMLLYQALSDAANRSLAEDSGPVQPWSDFFPFAPKTKLLVEYQITGPDPNIGTGLVLKRTRNRLKLKIHIDKIDSWGVHVPETDVLIDIDYKGEGSGNWARIVVNGQEFIDDNVTIRSKKSTRILSMSISILGQRVSQVALHRVDSGEAELKFKVQGDSHVLVLSKK